MVKELRREAAAFQVPLSLSGETVQCAYGAQSLLLTLSCRVQASEDEAIDNSK